MKTIIKGGLTGLACTLLLGCAAGELPREPQEQTAPVQIALAPYPQQVFWGDLHVHTNLSFDSNSFGNERLGPDEAYRFAIGEEVVASNGQRAKLARPLDFLMVADHAEFLGVLNSVRAQDRELLRTSLGERWSQLMHGETGLRGIMNDYVAMVTRQKPMDLPGEEFNRTAWNRVIDAAERHNRPGVFTALAGYEWTSMPGGRNLHRVVLFRDGPGKTRATLPFSALDSDDPERLWDYLESFESLTGGKVLAIAHNGNLSGGLMFDDKTLSGAPLSADYARRRQRWEPVYEVTQVKGDGEAHPLLSPDDRFADFETFYETDITMRPRSSDPEELREGLRGDYARAGLKKGLRYAETLGVNPYQFGLMGSTDTHTALATADDDNFWGKFLDSEPGPDRLNSKMGGNLWGNAGLASSGYTGVWARANTREEIFAALQRREVYATTGPRMRLRLFAGWNFAEADLMRADPDAYGYAAGVPMGGVLNRRPGSRGPAFMIRAMRDPAGAPLERVQVIKGWLDRDGETREKVYDVATASETGAANFNLVWRDPDFNPTQQAFYYVRLLQVPTKRWTTYDAERYRLELPDGVPRMIRERAYSSPVWYRPDLP
jgi:hypothetical protein